jgi:hypothetical protein
VVVISGCEIPKKPDFKTSHKVQAPVMYNKTFQLMGDSTMSVLIDTSSTDMDSLFKVDGDKFITISKEQNFEFGDMNDGIPTINVDPTSFSSQVGEIEITDFSESEGNIGEASFQDLTGEDPGFIDPGDPVPNQSQVREVTIDLNTDLFESATFKNGSLEITLLNNLGFDLDDVNIVLVSDPNVSASGDESDVANGNSGALPDNGEAVISIPFDENTCTTNPSECQLYNPNVRVSIEWTGTGQTFQREPQSLIVESAKGNNLTASQVRAALDEQDFSEDNVAEFDDAEFAFTESNHKIELKTGRLIIAPVENNMEFRINLDIIFTDIRDCPAGLVGNDFVVNNDPLRISYTGDERIRRADEFGPGYSPEANINLAGCELYALNNEVNYSIIAFTENTKNAPVGERIRTINEADSITSSVDLSNMNILEATGIIKPQKVLLNDDFDGDEILDLYNDDEAEVTEIDGLEDLSKQLNNIDFTNPSLTINYKSNIGIPTAIYGSFVGTSANGKEVFLTATQNTCNEASDFVCVVDSPEEIDSLWANGRPLNTNEVVKFTPEIIDDPVGRNGDPIIFTRNNSNVADFLNNLPTKIRFIGKAVINEDGQEATILDTLIFDPTINVDIPLAFATEDAATYTDTTEQDLGDVPSPENGDDTEITEGILYIDYENGIPLAIDLNIGFMDSTNTLFDSIPVAGEEINLLASGVDPVTRFADNPTSGTMQIALNQNQLRQLYKTKFLRISAELLTTDNSGDGTGDEVRLRTTDFIKLSVRAELTIESEVNVK